jgi:hypothetical protein
LAATIPLCADCNNEFGNDLEAPVATIFDQIEQIQGLSDIDAELLIRWLWKIKGLSWIATNPDGNYIRAGTLRQRVLYPINDIRHKLILALCLIRDPVPPSGEVPMGIDAETEHDAIFVSGVFSRLAMMVTLDLFEGLIPVQYDRYRLAPARDASIQQQVFFPGIGFVHGDEAVNVSIHSSQVLTVAHDQLALEIFRKVENGPTETG